MEGISINSAQNSAFFDLLLEFCILGLDKLGGGADRKKGEKMAVALTFHNTVNENCIAENSGFEKHSPFCRCLNGGRMGTLNVSLGKEKPETEKCVTPWGLQVARNHSHVTIGS